MDCLVENKVIEKKMDRENAFKECLKEVKDELATKVLVDKYFLTKDGNYLEWLPSHMWDRLARNIIEAENESNKELYYTKFRKVLDDFKFVPAGRILYGLGNPANVTLKNCYVIAIEEDSIKGIFDTAYKMAETYKCGGGCGIDISPLRPSGAPVNNAARVSTGAVSFMDFFSHVTGMIGQKARIGALLICIDVSHPDVEKFIEIKSGDLNLVRYANVSVKINDEFMQAVKNDSDFDLKWGGKVYKTIKAKQLWDKLIKHARDRAEPGLLFWDTARRECPADQYEDFKSIATNPCAEAQLSNGDSCNLGSMNLSKYVSNPFTDRATFNFSKYEEDIKTAVRFLDNIITLEKAPLEFQQAANDNGRRVGLGFMGLADMMAKMRIKFDSEEALKLIDLVSEAHRNASYEASCDLADEKGVFPAYDEEKCFKSPFINRLSGTIKDRIRESGLRNISLNAIAPTGSLSCIARCSSGIEPIFMLKYIRKTNLGTAKKVEEHEVFHPVAEEYTKEHGKELPEYFVEAHQVNPEFRVKMQGIIQKNLDLSISSTVNLKSDATEEDVANIYMQAYDVGCKGITVYRDGSREGVLVKKGSDSPSNSISVRNAPKRPKELEAEVHVIKPNGKKFAIFVGLLEGRVYEVFALDYKQARCEHGMSGKIIKEIAKKGNVYNFESGALMVRQLNRYEDTDASLITRLISTSLRHGTPLPFVIDQITKSKDGIGSFSRAIARALSAYINADEVKGMFTCTECKSKNVKFEGTCFSCLDCGFSRCS